MTDETKPITVKATATPVVMSEGGKLIAVAGFAVVADRFMHSETAIIAVMAASGAILTLVWGLWHRLRSWGALRYLASLVDDEVATVGNPK
ncbi:MAG: hypothetical protein WC718_01375 [Phycisphaerales bacterium]|jgi:hypothetical protein